MVRGHQRESLLRQFCGLIRHRRGAVRGGPHERVDDLLVTARGDSPEMRSGRECRRTGMEQIAPAGAVQRLTYSQVDVRVDGVADERVREVDARFPAGRAARCPPLAGRRAGPGPSAGHRAGGPRPHRQAAAPHGRKPYQRDGLRLKRQQAPAQPPSSMSSACMSSCVRPCAWRQARPSSTWAAQNGLPPVPRSSSRMASLGGAPRRSSARPSMSAGASGPKATRVTVMASSAAAVISSMTSAGTGRRLAPTSQGSQPVGRAGPVARSASTGRPSAHRRSRSPGRAPRGVLKHPADPFDQPHLLVVQRR